MKLKELHRRLGPWLRPLSLPYSHIMKMRRAYYDLGLFPQFTPGAPCVSVGNIAMGGTGKTPFTSWLLDWAEKKEISAVVLSRGYGGTPGKEPVRVTADTPAAISGDEPLMLARTHPKASVVVSPDRALGAYYAEHHCAPDLFILDDGMQHLAMMRHADIVLLRPEDLRQEWNRVLPSGSWREGKDALKTASAFAIKATPEQFARLKGAAEEHLGEFKKPFFSFTLAPKTLRPLLEPKVILEESFYHNKPYRLFSGIANPELFAKDAATFLGRPADHHHVFADHHPFTADDMAAMLKESAPRKTPLICTAKDAVKLLPLINALGNHPVWVLEGKLQFGPSLFTGQSFAEWWEAWWQAHREP